MLDGDEERAVKVREHNLEELSEQEKEEYHQRTRMQREARAAADAEQRDGERRHREVRREEERTRRQREAEAAQKRRRAAEDAAQASKDALIAEAHLRDEEERLRRESENVNVFAAFNQLQTGVEAQRQVIL